MANNKNTLLYTALGAAALLLAKKKSSGVAGIGNTDGIKTIRSTGRYTFIVGLWSGMYYGLDQFKVKANNEYDALDKVVTYIEKHKLLYLFADAEAEEFGEDGYIYVDATMEGANEPHYIRAENLRIIKM